MYLHTAAVGAAVVSAFWSMVNERFDPHTAKRVVARIAAGATVGGVVGGVVAWQLAHRVSLPTLLLVLAGVNAFAAFAAPAVGAGAERDPETEAGTGAIAILRETPYLRHLALRIALAAMGEAAIDYIFKATAAAEYDDSTSLVSFRLTDDGVEERRLWSSRRRRWGDLRRVQVGPGAALVSPFARPTWLDRYRGIVLQLDGADRDHVVAILRQRVSA